MVGGVVIGLTRQDGQVHVHVADCPHYPSHGRGDQCPRPDTCCVYCDETNQRTGEKVAISVGDSFWWQSGTCYWTPQPRGNGDRCGVDYDITLGKIGYSH